MTIDYSIECVGPNTPPREILDFAMLMLLVYPVAIPTAIGVLLWANRATIRGRTSRNGPPSLSYICFLFRLYGPAYW